MNVGVSCSKRMPSTASYIMIVAVPELSLLLASAIAKSRYIIAGSPCRKWSRLCSCSAHTRWMNTTTVRLCSCTTSPAGQAKACTLPGRWSASQPDKSGPRSSALLHTHILHSNRGPTFCCVSVYTEEGHSFALPGVPNALYSLCDQRQALSSADALSRHCCSCWMCLRRRALCSILNPSLQAQQIADALMPIYA